MSESSFRDQIRIAGKLAGLTLGLAAFFTLYVALFAGPRTGEWYGRFASPRQPSLVIGTSRSAQGIIPPVFNTSDFEFARPLYNFAFSNSTSPFGPTYLRAIKNKLEATDDRSSLFLIEVAPMAFLVEDTMRNADGEALGEADLYLGKLWMQDISPNVEFILRYYTKPYYTLALDSLADPDATSKPWTEIDKDGWLKVHIKPDPDRVSAGTKRRLQAYGEFMRSGQMSDVRIKSFEKLIEFCRSRGMVFLVRLPCSQPIHSLEMDHFPKFDSLMEEIAKRHGVPYFNYAPMSDVVQTIDGTHLTHDWGFEISRKLLSDIEASRKQDQN